MTTTIKRVAIVTGGARGIGRGVMERVAASKEYQGFILTYNSNQQAAESYVAELKAQYPDYEFYSTGGDLTLPASRNAIFDLYDDKFADNDQYVYELALLVANAGQHIGVTADNANGLTAAMEQKFGDGSLLLNSDDKDKKDESRIETRHMRYYQNLYGEAYVDLCEQALQRMKQAHAKYADGDGNKKNPFRGSIIGMSAPGVNPNSGKLIDGYDLPGSGKALMEHSTRYMALQVAKYNINVNLLSAAYTRSDAWSNVVEKFNLGGGNTEDFLTAAAKTNIPLGTFLEATDLGDWVVFLAGTGGGRFMTGQSLVIDGGMHLK